MKKICRAVLACRHAAGPILRQNAAKPRDLRGAVCPKANTDFRGECLVRDAVRSEQCSSLFLRDFPVFERIIGESDRFAARFRPASSCDLAIF